MDHLIINVRGDRSHAMSNSRTAVDNYFKAAVLQSRLVLSIQRWFVSASDPNLQQGTLPFACSVSRPNLRRSQRHKRREGKERWCC